MFRQESEPGNPEASPHWGIQQVDRIPSGAAEGRKVEAEPSFTAVSISRFLVRCAGEAYTGAHRGGAAGVGWPRTDRSPPPAA